jgi:hypothetical protein
MVLSHPREQPFTIELQHYPYNLLAPVAVRVIRQYINQSLSDLKETNTRYCVESKNILSVMASLIHFSFRCWIGLY